MRDIHADFADVWPFVISLRVRLHAPIPYSIEGGTSAYASMLGLFLGYGGYTRSLQEKLLHVDVISKFSQMLVQFALGIPPIIQHIMRPRA